MHETVAAPSLETQDRALLVFMEDHMAGSSHIDLNLYNVL